MVETKFLKTDFRQFELRYSEGFLSNIVFLKLTQLELLKMCNALKCVGNKSLILKLTKLISLVDKEKNETTDFKRKVPRATNGERIREWQDIRRT
jgi:hypothetical protein